MFSKENYLKLKRKNKELKEKNQILKNIIINNIIKKYDNIDELYELINYDKEIIENNYLYVIYEKLLYLIIYSIQLLCLEQNEEFGCTVYDALKCLRNIKDKTLYVDITDDEINNFYKYFPVLWNHIFCNKTSLHPNREKKLYNSLHFYVKSLCDTFNKKCSADELIMKEENINNFLTFIKKILIEIN